MMKSLLAVVAASVTISCLAFVEPLTGVASVTYVSGGGGGGGGGVTTNAVNGLIRTFDATNTLPRLVAATNATFAASKRYTDDAVISAGAVTPPVVTNISLDITAHYDETVISPRIEARMLRGESIAASQVTNAPWLTEHQSLAFTNDYRRIEANLNWGDVTNAPAFVTRSVTNGLSSQAWTDKLFLRKTGTNAVLAVAYDHADRINALAYSDSKSYALGDFVWYDDEYAPENRGLYVCKKAGVGYTPGPASVGWTKMSDAEALFGGTNERLKQNYVPRYETVVGGNEIRWYGGKLQVLNTGMQMRNLTLQDGFGGISGYYAAKGAYLTMPQYLSAEKYAKETVTNELAATVRGHVGNTANPHGVTAAQIGAQPLIPAYLVSASVVTDGGQTLVITNSAGGVISFAGGGGSADFTTNNTVLVRSITNTVDAAVLAMVAQSANTNAVAVLNEIVGGDWRNYGGGLAGLLAAILAAIVWLKTHKQEALAWKANTAYAAGQAVIQTNVLYICKVAHTSGASWDATEQAYWTALNPDFHIETNGTNDISVVKDADRSTAWNSADKANVSELPYGYVLRGEWSGTAMDRAINRMPTVTGDVAIAAPTPTSGRVGYFVLRFSVSAASVPTVTVNPPSGGTWATPLYSISGDTIGTSGEYEMIIQMIPTATSHEFEYVSCIRKISA